METLITVFHRYAGKEGNSTTLSRRELRQLMEAELANFLKVPQTTSLPLLSLFCSLIIALNSDSLSKSCTLISGSDILHTLSPCKTISLSFFFLLSTLTLPQFFLPIIVVPLHFAYIKSFCLSLQAQKDPATVDKIMKDLDTNGDGEVSFEEFVSLVVGLSIACEQCYQMHLKGKK